MFRSDIPSTLHDPHTTIYLPDNMDLAGFIKVHQAHTDQGLGGHEHQQQILGIQAMLGSLPNQLQQLAVLHQRQPAACFS